VKPVAHLLLAISAAVIGPVASAQTAAQSSTPASPTAAQAATSDSSATDKATANKPGRKVLVDDTVNDAQLKQILAKGYRPERQARGNEVYYCRKETELGSRFETKVCRTAARIIQEELQGKEATTAAQQTPGNKVTQ
jgi:uncharacterized protein